MHSLPLGADTERFRRRSSPRALLLHLNDGCTVMGCIEGLPYCQTFRQHAQKPGVHPLFRSFSIEQMGFPLRPVPRNSILLYPATTALHPRQVDFPGVRSTERNNPGNCASDHRSCLLDCCEHSTALDGQEDECFQHLHCRHEFPQCHFPTCLHGSVQSTRKFLMLVIHIHDLY